MKEHKSKVDIVYEYLIREMAKQNYKAGDRLIIRNIARACNVSDSPVREAFRLLESNGYVSIVNNQGAIAIGINSDSIREIGQIKGVLEGFATKLSIDYLSLNDLNELEQINARLRRAVETGDSEGYSAINVEFHMRIYQNIPQKNLVGIIRDLWEKWSITKDVFNLAPSRMDSSYVEHEQIIAMIRDREYDEVEQFVRKHKFDSADTIIKMLVQSTAS